MISAVIVLISFAVSGMTHSTNSRSWSHHDESQWPGMCTVGTEQSPIDIKPHETLLDPHGAHIRGDLVYRGYSNVWVTAENTGFELKFAPAAGEPAPVLSGGPLRANYTFVEVHFHWLSEHSINGIKYPLEIHLVHTKYGLSMAEAQQQRDGIAVVAVLGQVSSKGDSDGLDDFLPAMKYIMTKSEPTETLFNIDLMSLLGTDPQAFYTYHGSLTTPTCQEVVTFIVMDKPTTITHSNYKNMTRAHLDGINNDRSIQPLNQRLVYRSKYVSAACTHLASPTFLGSMAALISCLGSRMLTGMSNLLDSKKKIFSKFHKKCDD